MEAGRQAQAAPRAARTGLGLALAALCTSCVLAAAVEATAPVFSTTIAVAGPVRVAMTAMMYAVILAPVAAACARLRLRARDVGLAGPHVLASNLAGLGVGGLAAVMVPVAALFLFGLGEGPVLAGWPVVCAYAVAAFAEELLFRGFFQGRLASALAARAHCGKAAALVAVCVTAAAFALFHVPKLLLAGAPVPTALLSATPQFAGGLVFGAAARLTGDVYLAAWLHLAANLAVLAL